MREREREKERILMCFFLINEKSVLIKFIKYNRFKTDLSMFLWMNYRRSFERDLTSGLHPQRLSINDSVIHHIMHCVVVRSTYTAKRNYRIKIFQFYICLIYLYLKLSNSHSIFNFIISTHVHPINCPSLCRIFSKTF